MKFVIANSLNEINKQDYIEFKNACNAPIFYEYTFLSAAENYPLLSVEDHKYIVGYLKNEMSLFMPCYLQSTPDPFAILENTTNSKSINDNNALLSHIMHCYESTLLIRKGSVSHMKLFFNQLYSLAQTLGTEHFGFINVLDDKLLMYAKQNQMQVNYMWDRYFLDTYLYNSFDQFLEGLKAKDRKEYKRQLKKFNLTDVKVKFESPPFNNLAEIASLCFNTTSKYGTSQYYPPDKMVKFILECGHIIRIISLYINEKRIGAIICLFEPDILHLWACGMEYHHTDFSPYTVGIAKAIEFAINNNIPRVEIGRTNRKLKERLGFKPLALYSILSNPK